jgi:hypothetical protein
LKAKVYYTVTENGVSEQKTAEYTVSPAASSDGWQFVSTTFVPPQAESGQTFTADRIEVYAISTDNFSRVSFDDISLVMNAAECYEYNEYLLKMTSSETKQITITVPTADFPLRRPSILKQLMRMTIRQRRPRRP